MSQCYFWSNEQLTHQEVSHRRAITSYATGLTLSALTGIATLGAAGSAIVPIAGFKAYKIHCHYKKLKIIRHELTRRHLSAHEKRKRDVLILMTTTAAVYIASMGIAGAVDIVPDAMQVVIHEPIQEGFSLSDELMFEAANKYQAFIVAEIAEAGLKGRTKSNAKLNGNNWHFS